MSSKDYIQNIAAKIPPCSNKARYLQELEWHLEDAKNDGQKNPEKQLGKTNVLTNSFIMSEKNNIKDSLQFFTFTAAILSFLLFSAQFVLLSITNSLQFLSPIGLIASLVTTCILISVSFIWFRFLQLKFLEWDKVEIQNLKKYKLTTLLPAAIFCLLAFLPLARISHSFIGYGFILITMYNFITMIGCLFSSYTGLFSNKINLEFVNKFFNKNSDQKSQKISNLGLIGTTIYTGLFVLYNILLGMQVVSQNTFWSVIFTPFYILAAFANFLFVEFSTIIYNILYRMGITTSTGITFLHIIFALIVLFLAVFLAFGLFSVIKKMWKMAVTCFCITVLILSSLFVVFNRSLDYQLVDIPEGSKSLHSELAIKRYGKLNLFSNLIPNYSDVSDFITSIEKNQDGEMVVKYGNPIGQYSQIFDISNDGELILKEKAQVILSPEHLRQLNFDKNIVCENEHETQDYFYECVNPKIKNTSIIIPGKFTSLLINSKQNYFVAQNANGHYFFASIPKN